jgi:hypothetical protein
MTMKRTHRRSSFGTDCVQCGSELIAPEWTEYRNERQVHHVWRCWDCDREFESIVSLPVDGKSMKDIMTRADVFPSLLVA